MGQGTTQERPRPVDGRFYRAWATGRGLCGFEVTVAESNLQIFADGALPREAEAAVRRVRRDIEMYAAAHDGFLRGLEPLSPQPGAPEPVRRMCNAGALYGVGPMAAVAGMVAEHVGRELLRHSTQVMVENGGDVFFHADEPPVFGLYAGRSSAFTGRVRFTPRGLRSGAVCTSSGTVGHSMSYGRADAVVAIARDAVLADAAATAIGNQIRKPEDVGRAIEQEKQRGLLDGLLIAMGETLGASGAVEIVEGT
jgi:hypothetical protein